MIIYRFHAEEAAQDCIEWIRSYFDEAKCDKAVIGISGGKDSAVVAALCAAALGKERALGVMLPQGRQPDIEDSRALIHHLEIPSKTINIGSCVDMILNGMYDEGIELTDQTRINLPARIRMATLFAVAQSVNGRVANTCNLSENWVGYSTLFGDNAGQFAPIAQFTVQEVKEIGRVLGIPEHLLEKTPSDGLCGKNDEDSLGFSYDTLDRYIRTGEFSDFDIKKRIDHLNKMSRFKEEIVDIPCFRPDYYIFRQRIFSLDPEKGGITVVLPSNRGLGNDPIR